jgi:hypothetical protein
VKKEFKEYPKEFDSQRFLDFIRERFGSPIMAEEELLIRFTKFIAPRQQEDKEITDDDIKTWYESLVTQLNSMERPLDAVGTDISDPHGLRRPTLEKRVQDQNRDGVSMASGLLQEMHRKEEADDEKKKPKGPQMGEED